MIQKHINSYRYAFRGIMFAFRSERNMIIHLVAAIAVIGMNYVLNISATEWMITLVLIAVVWSAEIFNTAIERLADRVNNETDPLIAQVKDLSAGAVLIICLVAVVCALIIYVPYLTR